MSETIKTISLPGVAWKIAADIHFPPNFDEKKKYPAVVSVHPIGSCKEETSGNIYGKAMANEGFVVIAFDAGFQGASGGEPRFIENPEFRVSDFRAAVDYLQTLPYVDPDLMGRGREKETDKEGAAFSESRLSCSTPYASER